MKNEVWKPVKGYEGFYEVSNKGRVRSVERRDADGKSKTFTLKKLVAGAFLEAPQANEKLVYVDGNPDNVCVENIKWQKKRKRKRNIYSFEDNKTGEVFEGSISDCCDAWDLTKPALLGRARKGRVTKTLICVAGLRTFTDIETGEEFNGTKHQAREHFKISWNKFYDRIESGLIQIFPPYDESANNEDKISDPKTKRLLNKYYLIKINELGSLGENE